MDKKLSCEDRFNLAGDPTMVLGYNSSATAIIYKNAAGEVIPNPRESQGIIVDLARTGGKAVGNLLGATATGTAVILGNGAVPLGGIFVGGWLTGTFAGAAHGAIYGPGGFENNGYVNSVDPVREAAGEFVYTKRPSISFEQRLEAAKHDAGEYGMSLGAFFAPAYVGGKIGADIAGGTAKEIVRAVNYGVCKLGG